MRKFLPSLISRLIGGFKAGAYLSLLSLAVLFASTRAARGALGEVSLTLARQLTEVPDLLGSTKTIELNGQPFQISTAVAPFSAKAVLDRFAEACRHHPGELARVATAHGLRPLENAVRGSGQEPLVRLDGDNDGVVGCLLESPSSLKGSLNATIQEFLRTRDAAVFGDFLVVYAKNQDDGKSHIVATWTRGPLKILDLFPAQGDAPGSDSVLVGRPRGARRILSGSAQGEPYAIRIYETTEAPAALLEGFTAELQSRGWTALPAQPAAQAARALRHASGLLTLLSTSVNAGKTTIVILEMGNGDPNRGTPP